MSNETEKLRKSIDKLKKDFSDDAFNRARYYWNCPETKKDKKE